MLEARRHYCAQPSSRISCKSCSAAKRSAEKNSSQTLDVNIEISVSVKIGSGSSSVLEF